jgi:hypothetical protein
MIGVVEEVVGAYRRRTYLRPNGAVAQVYEHLPLVMRFSSPLVSPENFHFMGLWSWGPRFGTPEQSEVLLARVVAGQKPLASITLGMGMSMDEARTAASELSQRGAALSLSTHYVAYNCQNLPETLLACPGRLGEIFDLEALAADYQDALDGPQPKVAAEIARGLKGLSERTIASFFAEWLAAGPRHPKMPYWLTGLLLGYPPDDTISHYLGRAQPFKVFSV